MSFLPPNQTLIVCAVSSKRPETLRCWWSLAGKLTEDVKMSKQVAYWMTLKFKKKNFGEMGWIMVRCSKPTMHSS